MTAKQKFSLLVFGVISMLVWPIVRSLEMLRQRKRRAKPSLHQKLEASVLKRNVGPGSSYKKHRKQLHEYKQPAARLTSSLMRSQESRLD